MPPCLEEMPVLILNTSSRSRFVRANAILSSLTAAQCIEETESGKEESEMYGHLCGLMKEVDDSVTLAHRCHVNDVLREYADIFQRVN